MKSEPNLLRGVIAASFGIVAGLFMGSLWFALPLGALGFWAGAYWRPSAPGTGLTAGAWAGIVLLVLAAALVALVVWYVNRPGHW